MARTKAREKYQEALKSGGMGEALVSGSEDCTMYLWHPEKTLKPVARLTGHQKMVNQVLFSPDARVIVSASFDSSLKLWNAKDGSFIHTLRGHVAAVYQCAFSSDSRLIVSGSKDTTLKIWDIKTGKMVKDLPGHEEEVFAVDWAVDGKVIASGGRDKKVKLWVF